MKFTNFEDVMNNIGTLELGDKVELEIVEAITKVIQKNADKIKAKELRKFCDDNDSLDKDWGQTIMKDFYKSIIEGRCENCFELLENEDYRTNEKGYVCSKCKYEGSF